MYHPFSVTKNIIWKQLNFLFNEISTDLKFIFEVLSSAWSILFKNFGIILIYSILSVIVISIIGAFSEFTNIKKDIITPLIIFFAILIIQAYTTLGLYKLIFTLIDSEYYEFEFKQIVPNVRMIVTYVILSILSAIIIASYNTFILGLLLKENETVIEIFKIIELIVILYLALRYMFCICFIVDDSSGAFESLRQSFHLTKSNIFKIILLLVCFFIIIAIPIIGAFKFDLKILLAFIILIYPYINIVLAVVYRKLIHDANGVDDIVAEII